MATVRSFQSMLNEYLPYQLLKEEMERRNWYLQNAQKDMNWKGGPLIVPFRAARASTYKYGGLTPTQDVNEFKFVRGEVSDYKELWGTMFWNSRDLLEHSTASGQSGPSVKEQSFLSNLPDQIEEFLDGMKEVSSVNFLVGNSFAAATVGGDVSGNITVDHPERFEINQAVFWTPASTPARGYVDTIDVNTGALHITQAQNGAGGDVDLSAVIAGSTAHYDGATTATNAFTSYADQVLSAANGGPPQIFGVDKVDQPYTQAINIDGSGMTKTNILEQIFDGWTFILNRAKGTRVRTVAMSYSKLGDVMKLLEVRSGPFKHTATRANVFGWTEIDVQGVKGQLTLVGVQEMPEDKMYYIDWGGIKIHSNGMFRKQRDPEGKLYYTVRNAGGSNDGYQYFVDISMYGENVVYKPANQGVLHSVPQTLA